MRRILFTLFFISGFSSLVYQVVWTRLAFASFGIILPVLSVVISVFMLGLSVGAWGGGQAIRTIQSKSGFSAALFYAATELMIGVGAFAVPKLFKVGEQLLLSVGASDSARYLFLSAVVLTLSILPWCLCMGATVPLMMAYVREREPASSESFSFLYLANVLGAMCGTLVTALVLVELFGFHRTLMIAAAGNVVVAATGLWLGLRGRSNPVPASSKQSPGLEPAVSISGNKLTRWILFTTGFCAMAMEVVWTRAFTPVLRTQVYSFASIVFCYLGATSVGSWLYRRHLRRGKVASLPSLLSFLAVSALLPVLVDDFRLLPREWLGPMDPWSAMMLLASIGPLCGVLGYLTPSLIDAYAGGDPRSAGKAYALNVLGCILGPLFACYVMLPRINERYTLILLSLPFFVFWWLKMNSLQTARRWLWGGATGAALACSLFVTQDFPARVLKLGKHAQVRRDYTAFVISVGEDRSKLLMVNGMGMTVLSPVTKYMVHLPLALHEGKADSVLIICFGMGTTHRSSLSWNVDTTTVELVPSVRDAFGFFHSDAADVVRNSKGRIFIDDGRRFLKRTSEKFDVIVLDPPPPVMTAGSSLLYSSEFYELAKQRLKANGILQTWVPLKNIEFAPAVFRSLHEAFPYTRCFKSLEAGGFHMLGSMERIPVPGAAELVARIPPNARKDLLEWSVSGDLTADVNQILSMELAPTNILNADRRICITDDRPYNEYYLLRYLNPEFRRYTSATDESRWSAPR